MCPKVACHQNAMNITIMTEATLKASSLTAKMAGSSADWHCLSLTKEAKDPVDMAVKMYAAINGDGTNKISSDCVKFHCAVLFTALTHQDLVLATKSTTATGCPSTTGSKQSSDESNCVCSGLYQTVTAAQIVEIEDMCAKKMPTTTTVTTTTSTSTTVALSGAVGRRMLEAPAEWDMAENVWHDLDPKQEPDDERRLNHVPPTQAPVDPKVNEGLPEHTVGKWSPCTCYQACNGGTNMLGIENRRVKCMSATCKEPMPEVSKTCYCLPCADCVVSMETMLVTALCAVEAVLCILMWLSLAYMSSVVSVSEAMLVSLSFGQKFLGCFVTRFPFLIRLGVLVNTALAIYFVIVTFVPKDILAYQTDCGNVSGLWVLSIFFPVLMVVMIIAGTVMRKTKRMQPFIFRPARHSKIAPIRIFSKFLSSLGP